MAIDNYTITIPATEDPVTLDEVKSYCIIEHSLDDTLLTILISAAVQLCEGYTNRVFVSRTYIGNFQDLYESRFEKFSYLEVQRAPLVSISVLTVEVSGIPTAWTDYEIKQGSGFSRVIFTEIPTVDNTAYPISVSFTAGYGTAADVPDNIKLAIMSLVCFLYVNRGDCSPCDGVRIPATVKAILNSYRIVNTFG